jgi:hypothetical protein
MLACRAMKSFVQMVGCFLVCVFLYAVISFVVFDYTEKAYYFDAENNSNGIELVCGPLPRKLLCYPTYHDIHYTGNEWPFLVYYPICYCFAKLSGCSTK